MADLNSTITKVARWLTLKRREGVTVAASVFHDYLLQIDAPDDTVERCEAMNWIVYQPAAGYSSAQSDFSGNLYPGPIRWIEAQYVIGSVIEAGVKPAPMGPSVGPDPGIEDSASHTDPDGPQLQTQPLTFQGGTMNFLEDRVELCGIDICSGPRCRKRRQILELLKMKHHDGHFLPYGADQLADSMDPIVGVGTVPGIIRDLRDDIIKRLRGRRIVCGPRDVVLSGGTGYRLAEHISVHLEGQPAADEISCAADGSDLFNVPKDVAQRVGDIWNRLDDPAQARRAWILAQLNEGRKLQTVAVAKQFECSLKTAQRDLRLLKAEGAIEFIGPRRTGYYQLSDH